MKDRRVLEATLDVVIVSSIMFIGYWMYVTL